MSLQSLAQRVRPYGSARYTRLEPGLGVAAATAPRGLEVSFYQPLVCLILQGSKETTLGARTVLLDEGRVVVVSHHLPVTARIRVASPDRPYLALVCTLDLAELAEVHAQVADALPPAPAAASYAVATAKPALLDVFGRYLDLVDDPVEARVLRPMVRRELCLRLLRGENSGMLRHLLAGSSHARQVAEAIQTLRTRYRERLEVNTLAQSVGMSPSSFYRHFKAVTSTTPLQYQKDLRLTEARRLLARGEHSVSTAAFDVGYESPSQFSREYARRFGAAPSRDLQRAG
jgi:AraC-like DNA-binding protein